MNEAKGKTSGTALRRGVGGGKASVKGFFFSSTSQGGAELHFSICYFFPRNSSLPFLSFSLPTSLFLPFFAPEVSL